MRIVIYSDYVCPFCLLEVPALERLAREEGVELDYRAYELQPEPQPTLDPGGSYILNIWRDSVYPMAERLGIPIKLPPFQPRTRLAFEGAEFARDAGKLGPYTRAVFEAYFQEGRDIGKPEVLEEIAAGVGLDAPGFRQALEDHRYLARVLEQEAEASRIGIQEVPAAVIGGRVLRGAASYETLRRAVEAARAAAEEEGGVRSSR